MATTKRNQAAPIDSIRLHLTGQVQGVGFRPFVYRLGNRLGLKGWVRNRSGQVEIEAHGDPLALQQFQTALLSDAPPLARPRIVVCEAIESSDCAGFRILDSRENADADIHVPPDYFACDDCIRELFDPNDRRYRYPFINCTQCGPRYTLIERLPYDRRNTAMAAFALCDDCRAEYDNPRDRRFHSEPLACPVCGPRLTFVRDENRIDDPPGALAACATALRAGDIVAVKGIGGYHLMCDATQDAAVARLRERKRRPDKPLAVMFPMNDDLAALRRVAALDAESERRLRDPVRPIVLIRRREDAELADGIAPKLDEIGAMLPYSPLHHLLLEAVGRPLVATSANISGEPVLTRNADVESRLHHVVDACLHHDRPIVRPADDPVLRVIAGRARALRLGRGNAPLEWELPRAVPPTLAVGAHTKNTVAIAWGKRAVISPHIGTLSSLHSLEIFNQVINDLQNLYEIRIEQIACDFHPGYTSSRWAATTGLPVKRVLHHHAHASAVAGEYPQVARWLVFTWDGVGYGEDGTLWGGEALLGRPGEWRRVATMRPFRLPGGEKAGRQPWRSACALTWEIGAYWNNAPRDAGLLRQAWEQRLNTPTTTAVGRLFDAAAAMLGLAHTTSFEAQAPMRLETSARRAWPAQPLPLPIRKNTAGIREADWAPLIPALQDQTKSIDTRAAQFHASLAHLLQEIAKQIRDEHGDFAVGLAGGVFQNRLLTEHGLALLADAGFDAHLPQRIPANDAGISFGQLVNVGSAQPTPFI